MTTLCLIIFMGFFLSDLQRNLLNASKVRELNEVERIQLVYVFQSSHRKKACAEFLAVSQAYMQVNSKLAGRLCMVLLNKVDYGKGFQLNY